MRNTNLVKLLRVLTTRERSRFKEFVFSPFFNKNEKLKLLCVAVLHHAPTFEHAGMRKATIFRKVFGKEAFDERRLNNYISFLLQLLYDFLAQLRYGQKAVMQKNYLLEELLERDQHHQMEKNARKYRQLQDASPLRNYEHYLQEYNYYDKMDRYVQRKIERRFDDNLQRQSDNLDLFYFGNKLRLACEMASRNTVIKAGYEPQFLNELLQFYESNTEEFKNIPALKLYYKTLQMLRVEDATKYYHEVKALLANHSALFPKVELYTLYYLALNFCIKKINSGWGSYYREVLDLYKVLLEKKIIFFNGYLTQWTYKNIITAGIRLKEFDWTENFIQQFKDSLLPEDQYNATTYNLAALYYARQEYKKALHLLFDVEFTDTSYHLGAKIIQLKSYYELDETEAFYALIEAFRKFITRNRQVGDYRKKANGNFLKIAKKVYQLKQDQNHLNRTKFQKKYLSLQAQVAVLEPLANKDWLQEVMAKF